MRLLAALLAVPALILAWQWWSDTSIERELSPIASEIAGRSVHVDCQTLWGALIDTQPRHGEVRFNAEGVPDNRIFLTHDTCRRLARFAGKSQHGELRCLRSLDWRIPEPMTFGHPCYESSSKTIYAVLILAHEAYHTAGIQNEAVTNCYATQSMGYAAAALGAEEVEAQYLALAMNRLLPIQQGSYQTDGCTKGSDLDLFPTTSAFPTELPIRAFHGRGGNARLASGA
ncbi:MAG: hypothetical protein U0R50_01945 [Gaiellales bacterium]